MPVFLGANYAFLWTMALADPAMRRQFDDFNLALLPGIVCVVILMVSGSIGAGVAVAGTFSLVRFRSAPGTAREILAVFLAVAESSSTRAVFFESSDINSKKA